MADHPVPSDTIFIIRNALRQYVAMDSQDARHLLKALQRIGVYARTMKGIAVGAADPKTVMIDASWHACAGN